MSDKSVKTDTAMRARSLREDRRRSLGLSCSEPESCTASKTTQAFLEAPEDPALLLDCQGVVLALNQAASVALSGTSEGVVLGDSIFDYLPPEVVADRRDLFEQVLHEGKPVRFEDEMSGVFYQHCLYPVMDMNGRVERVVVFAANISDRKRMEAELFEEKDRAARYLEVASVMLLALDAQGRVSLVNRKGCEVLGYREDEIVGQDWFTRFLPEPVRGQLRGEFDRLCAGEAELSEYFENDVISADGRRRLVAWRNSVLKDAQGRFTGVLCSGEDITDRRKAEDALKASERAYRDMVANIPAVAWTADVHGQIQFIGENVEKVLGYTAEEVHASVDNLWFGLVHSEDYDRVVGSWNALLTMGRPYDVEYRILRRDGTWIWLHDKALRTQNCDGGIHIDGVFSDVTERKRAEESLRDSEEKYRQLFSTETEAIVILEAENFTICDVNEAALRLYGYTREEMLGSKAVNLSAELDRTQETLEQWRQGVGHRVPLGYHRKKDGSVFPVEVSSRVFALRGSRAVCAMVRDIGDRLAAEEARRQSEEKLKGVTSAAKDAIVMSDEQGRVVFWNPAAEQVFGYTKEEVLGQVLWGLVFPEEVFSEAMARILSFGQTGTDEAAGRTTEQNLRRKNGEVFPAEMSLAAMEVDGRWHSVSIVRDITRRRKAEETLRQSEHKYRTLVERASEGIVIIQDGLVKYANPSLAKILGYSVEELIDTSFLDYAHPDELAAVKEIYDDRMSGEASPTAYSSVLRHRDGHRISVEVSAAVIQYEDRPADLGSLRDVTEIERLWKLESRAKRLETAGQIAGQVAHDFNNLLGPLMAYPGIARDELPEDHPVLAYLDEIEKSARQIADINRQLLTLGRRGHYNQEPLSINEVVREVVRDIGDVPSTLVVEVLTYDNLFNVMAGRAQIHRALSNLVVNARDALQDIGQINLVTENMYVDNDSIRYGTVPRGEYVKITISDNGSGIPEEIAQKIFDPFFSTKTADKKRGSGLGLSVVDAVVKDHNGHLDMQSAVGQGTSFYIYLPITREALPDSAKAEIVGGTETVLVVDDDEVQRTVLLRLLANLGYQAQAVKSGEEAVNRLQNQPYNLVVLDMVMPNGIDGAETFRRILRINPAQKALIVSGFAESDRVQTAQRIGAGAYIRKPLTRETIAQALRHELAREVITPG